MKLKQAVVLTFKKSQARGPRPKPLLTSAADIWQRCRALATSTDRNSSTNADRNQTRADHRRRDAPQRRGRGAFSARYRSTRGFSRNRINLPWAKLHLATIVETKSGLSAVAPARVRDMNTRASIDLGSDRNSSPPCPRLD